MDDEASESEVSHDDPNLVCVPAIVKGPASTATASDGHDTTAIDQRMTATPTTAIATRIAYCRNGVFSSSRWSA